MKNRYDNIIYELFKTVALPRINSKMNNFQDFLMEHKTPILRFKNNIHLKIHE